MSLKNFFVKIIDSKNITEKDCVSEKTWLMMTGTLLTPMVAHHCIVPHQKGILVWLDSSWSVYHMIGWVDHSFISYGFIIHPYIKHNLIFPACKRTPGEPPDWNSFSRTLQMSLAGHLCIGQLGMATWRLVRSSLKMWRTKTHPTKTQTTLQVWSLTQIQFCELFIIFL